jgi:hypothetical protein
VDTVREVVPTKLQNYITDNLANKAVFMADTIPGPSTAKHRQGKPIKWVMWLQDYSYITAT